jgi:hypothetical protein
MVSQINDCRQNWGYQDGARKKGWVLLAVVDFFKGDTFFMDRSYDNRLI